MYFGKTFFSYRYGTFATKDLVATAVEKGITTLALTNINGTPDCWDFIKFCREAGIRPVVGTEIRNNGHWCYTLLAANNNGLQWINEFLSEHLLNKKDFPPFASQPFFVNPSDGYVIYPYQGKKVSELFPNELIGIKLSESGKLFALPVNESSRLIIYHPVSFQNKKYYNLHRLLRAIDKNVVYSKLAPSDMAGIDEYFISPDIILQAFKRYPGVITNTYRVLESCELCMDFKEDKNKKCFTASREDDRILLEKLSSEGLFTRYGNNKVAKKRLEKELKIINDLGFNAYFLVTWDIIRYAQSRGFYYVGRGSGANSIVAYCLRITDVDPIELNLYFERFLNPERTSPPDFDIDFSWLDRDEIIDYILKRHGKKHTALLGMYSTFQYRASVRELGKVFGLPKEELDHLSDNSSYFLNADTEKEKIYRLVIQYAKLMINFPNHLSIHPGGILISELPISYYTALEMPPKGFPTAQIDMFIAENIHLDKLDILSQRGLGHIKETIRLVRKNRGIDINITQVEKFKQDPQIKAKIKSADTIGCFYVESPAMRQLLKKLRCDSYATLVDASSIIRPGVAESGMMRQYIQRYHHPTDYTILHPKLHEILKDTFDVMVFQEDVIRVGHEFAGLSLGEADILRRAMSGKYRSNNTFQLIREKYFRNCKELGYDDELAAEVWRQMESFAGYSFCKAHSASFAVESFQDLYLKVYYPLEFLVGVVNNFGGFYSTELYFYQLLKAGATLNLPCVNTSEYYTSINGQEVTVGLIHIKGLEKQLAEKILTEREQKGNYLHLLEFIERTGITIEQLNLLVQIGAFRFTGKNKKQLLWEANFLQKKSLHHLPSSHSIFEEKPREFTLPDFYCDPVDDLYDEQEIFGFPLRNPFDMVDDDPASYCFAADLPGYLGKSCTVLAYYIANKIVPTKQNNTMAFGTFVDGRLDWLDTVHFPDSLSSYPLQGRGFYRITGTVIQEFGVYSLNVSSIQKVGYKKRKFANL